MLNKIKNRTIIASAATARFVGRNADQCSATVNVVASILVVSKMSSDKKAGYSRMRRMSRASIIPATASLLQCGIDACRQYNNQVTLAEELVVAAKTEQ